MVRSPPTRPQARAQSSRWFAAPRSALQIAVPAMRSQSTPITIPVPSTLGLAMPTSSELARTAFGREYRRGGDRCKDCNRGARTQQQVQMGVSIPLLPLGARVRVQRGIWPLEEGVEGRTGNVTDASEYRAHRYGVVLDGEQATRYFRPEELAVVDVPEPTPDSIAAKRRRALP